MGYGCAAYIRRRNMAVDRKVGTISSVLHRDPIIGIQLGVGEEKDRPLVFFGLSLLFWTLQVKYFLD